MINFLVQSYMVALSITLLYNPSSRMLIASAVAVLLPIAIARCLRLVVVLGKAMNVKDANSLWSGDDTSTADEKQIRSLVKTGMTKEQIVEEVERRQQQEKQDVRRKRQSKRRRLQLERQGVDEELELADLGSGTRGQITPAENPMRPALAKRGSEGGDSSHVADIEGRASVSGSGSGARPSARPSLFGLFRDSIPFASMLGGDESVSSPSFSSASIPPPIAPPASRPSTHLHVHHNASDTVGVNPNALSLHPVGHRLKFSPGHTAPAGPLPPAPSAPPTPPSPRPLGASLSPQTVSVPPTPAASGASLLPPTAPMPPTPRPFAASPLPPTASPPPLRLASAAPVAPAGSLLPTIARLPVTPPVPPTRPSPPRPRGPPNEGPTS